MHVKDNPHQIVALNLFTSVRFSEANTKHDVAERLAQVLTELVLAGITTEEPVLGVLNISVSC